MKPGILISALCLVTSVVAASQPSFDPKDVVRRVHEARGGTAAGSGPFADDAEFMLDTNVVYVPTRGDQMEAAVAFDGTNFLVVWEDYSAGYFDIHGARVSQSGAILDPLGIAISGAASFQYAPAVVFDGTDFLVAWQDYRAGNFDIYGARVNLAGIVLDPDGIAISTATDRQESPAVALDGPNFLVVWADHRGGEYEADIYGARVSQEGTVLDPNGIAISTAAHSQLYPAVVFDGTNCFVVWEDSRGSLIVIYGARVDQSGTVLDPDGVAISTALSRQRPPAVAFDGTNFLVVWGDYRGGDCDIYGARVSRSGTVLDPSGIAISTAAGYQYAPAAAFDGADFLVVWTDQRNGQNEYDIYGARVSPAGTVLDPDGVAISVAAYSHCFPAVAFDGTNSLVVWHDLRNGSYDIYGARLSQAGTVLDPDGVVVSTAANDQQYPAVAFDGTNFLVVWQDYRSFGDLSDIYGARVSQTGIVLDPSGVIISAANSVQAAPAVSYDGADFLVVWEDWRNNSWSDVYGARVNPAGVVLDPSGIAISTAEDDQYTPAVAFDGANFLVVWEDWRPSTGDCDVYGARVSPAGAVLDPDGIVISSAEDDQYVPAVAFDGANFLVVWMDGRGYHGYNIYGARVSQAGAVLDTSGIAVSMAADDQYYPAVASDGANSLVVWEDYRTNSDTSDIYGARVSQAGTVIDTAGLAISTAAGWQMFPVAASDGTNFLVVWTDHRIHSDCDIYGARVSPAGVVFDSGPVCRQEGCQHDPTLARGSGNQTLLVYQGWAGTVGGKTYNNYRIWGKMDPNPGIEETMNDERGTMNVGPTIVRGVLRLPVSPFTIHTSLFDMTGRQVMSLRPGPNDVRHLAPGVYFIREAQAQAQAQAVQKVVITK